MTIIINPYRFAVTGPNQLFADDFNRANANLEADPNWTRVDGAAGMAAVSSNKLTLGSTTSAYQAPDMATAHHYAECDITAQMDAVLACRVHGRFNYIGLRPFRSNQFQILQYDGNTLTTLADVNFNGINHRIRLEVQGNTASAYIDGVLKAGPVAIAGNHRGGRAGFISRNATYTEIIDNFACGSMPYAAGQYIPATATFADDFNRANANLEADPNWTRVGGAAGAAAVNSNSLSFASTTETAYQGPNLGSADHWCQATRLPSVSGGHFLACRVQDVSNYVGCRQTNSTDKELFKKVAGTFTSLGVFTSAPTPNEVWRLEVVGTNVTWYVNGAQILTRAIGSHTSTPTRAGFIPRNATQANLFDDYSQGLMVAE